MVEIVCHGGDLAPVLVLRRLEECGARLAAPGEFTQRAFLNGKLDLAQAEAVADLIHASSSAAHRVSMAHLRGRYSVLLADLRQELLDLAAFIELELDFSEEDVAFADRVRLADTLERGAGLIRRLLDSYRTGSSLREGVTVVIGGRPNAGKSTLLNALVGFDRAIVSDQPGTTRDELQEEAEIEGLRFVFTDTAGLRDTGDAIEAEGVSRARRAIESADVLIYVYDLTAGLAADEQETLHTLQQARPTLPVLIVGNKRDLYATEGRPYEVNEHVLPVSARTGLTDERELAALVGALVAAAGGAPNAMESSGIVTNQRHRAHLERAFTALTAANEKLSAGMSGDLLALDLRLALDEIGAITGVVTNEDVLDQIFSRFCIGK